MTDQHGRRPGLRQTIEKLLGDEATPIGFAGRGQARRARALALGVERAPGGPTSVPRGADFVVFSAPREGDSPLIEAPWGVPASPKIGDKNEGTSPDFVVLSVDDSLASLPPMSAARVVRTRSDLPPELVRPLNGLRPEALLVRLSQGEQATLRDLLRIGMFAGAVQAPIIAELDTAPDRERLELLASLGVNGVVLTGEAASDAEVARTREAIDAIDVKELRQRRASEREHPVVVPFAPRRAEEPEPDEDDDEEERLG